MLVEGVSYWVNWQKFKRGMSITIPCLDPYKAKLAILETTNRLKIKVLTKVIVKDGIQCLRIWRL